MSRVNSLAVALSYDDSTINSVVVIIVIIIIIIITDIAHYVQRFYVIFSLVCILIPCISAFNCELNKRVLYVCVRVGVRECVCTCMWAAANHADPLTEN